MKGKTRGWTMSSVSAGHETFGSIEDTIVVFLLLVAFYA